MKKIVWLFGLVVLLAMVGCSMPYEFEEPDPLVSHEVVYRVSGSCGEAGLITIENKDGGTSQFSDVSLPWEYSFSRYYPYDAWLYVSAQNGTSSGSITVEILVDGNVWKTSTSTGAYVIATTHS